MFYFVLVFIGVFVVFLGSIRLMFALKSLHEALSRFEGLNSTHGFASIESFRLELDELNYSYYELLSDCVERIEVLEDKLNRIIARPQGGPAPEVEGDTQVDQPPIEHVRDERTLTLLLIEQGYSDQDIARILGIGVGKVGVLRRLEVQKKHITESKHSKHNKT